jgi:tetratricopeptide (TPR) repeat protein
MFCTSCGTKNAADSKFCKQCGHELEKTTGSRVREEDFDRALPEDEQINALLERAYRARKAGDTAHAIVLCQEALQLRPDSTTAHSLLGQLYESIGEHDLAIRAYERVLQLNPGSIADRVKLDELRGGDLPALRGAPAPHIVLTQDRPRQSVNQLMGGIALAIILLLVGASVGLAWRVHSALTGGTNSATTNGTRTTSTGPAGQNNTISNNVRDGASPANATADKQNLASTQAPVTTASAYNPFPWNMPPTIIYQQEPIRTIQTQPPSSADHGTGLAPVRMSNAKPGNSGNGGGRVFLQEEQSDGATTVIPVGPQDTQKAAGPGRIDVYVNPKGSATPDRGQAAGYDARSHIAAGDDYKSTQEWDKAIQAYSLALPTAGDEVASVYQQIALCYQRKGDKTSAITNYHTSIKEFQKLIDAGKQVELAQEGINTCEKAIKACNF